MDNFSLLQSAIKNRNIIEFDYQKTDWSITHRIGDPYVLYIYRDKEGKESMKLDFVQTDGDSSTKTDKPFPSFRSFIDIKDIRNLLIGNDKFTAPFHTDYNPDSDRYINLIIKL